MRPKEYKKYIFLDLDYCDKHAQQFLDIVNAVESDQILLIFDIFENHPVDDDLSKKIRAFHEFLSNRKIKHFFILNDIYDHDKVSDLPNIKFLTWGLAFTYYCVFVKKYTVSETYNPSSGKSLFLVGKGNKTQRIGLLKYFYERNNLDSLLWSFSNSPSVLAEIRNRFFSEYSDLEYEKFLNICIKKLDLTYEDPEVFSHDGFPCDHTLYQRTGLSIISETCVQGWRKHLVTEKTWRPIINKHPFIMVGPYDNSAWLRNIGFYTFDDYFYIKDYDTVNDLEKRMKLILINVVNFKHQLENDSTLIKSLQEKVNHNYDLLVTLSKNNMDNFLLSIGEPNNLEIIGTVIKLYTADRI